MRAYHEPSVLSVWTAGRRSRSLSDLVNSIGGVGVEGVGCRGGLSGRDDGCRSPRAALSPSPPGSLPRLVRDVEDASAEKNGIPAEAVRTCFGTMEVILNLVTADASPLSPPSAVSPHLHTHTSLLRLPS